jgi:hypothetical protein
MGELLNLQNYLASVRDDLEKHKLHSFESNINTAIGILMDYRTSEYHLSKRSIEKLIQYAGVLNLILIHSKEIAELIDKAVKDTETKQLDSKQLTEDIATLGFRIGELAIDHPQMNNDLDFFKTMYNRNLDKNLNKRKE